MKGCIFWLIVNVAFVAWCIADRAPPLMVAVNSFAAGGLATVIYVTREHRA